MTLTNFSVVLLGENFPVQSIKLRDFRYRNRELDEKLRLPVALQAENALVVLQIFPDRFEVRVKEADRLDKQVQGVLEMVSTFLEYVGKRTVTAIGHNAQALLPGDETFRSALLGEFVQQRVTDAVVGSSAQTSSLAVSFDAPGVTRAQFSLVTDPNMELTANFNFHFDVESPQDLNAALANLDPCLQIASVIADRTAALGEKVVSS